VSDLAEKYGAETLRGLLSSLRRVRAKPPGGRQLYP